MNRTRISLYYLAGYLMLGGFALLFFPHATLRLLQSNGDYGEVFPRLAGMLMSGLGLNIAGIIRAHVQAEWLGSSIEQGMNAWNEQGFILASPSGSLSQHRLQP